MTDIANKTNTQSLETLKDAREGDDGKVADTWRHRSRSGNVFELSDKNGKEHVTLQHRSGSLIQMQPDGSVRLVSSAGKMGIEINGEGYLTVTGLYNVVVNGDAGFRISGNADWQVDGDMKVTVNGTYSIAAKNMTTTIAEKYELTADNMSYQSTDNAIFTAGSKMYVGSTGSAKLYSGDTLTIVGDTKIDMNP